MSPHHDGIAYRDLNRNGVMDPFENPTLPVDERVADLVARLSLPEKCGLMFQPVMEAGADGDLVESTGGYSRSGTREVVLERHITHVNVHALGDARSAARWMNRLQRLAEEAPHGIPVTVSSDPRHGFVENSAVSFTAGPFSQWPEPLGLAAVGDETLMREFAETARREYVAVGIRAALHPTIDLATEPRWGRQLGTFGQDADLAIRMLRAYLAGFQRGPVAPGSVACTTKHFPGGGPQKDGEDPHFPYGREQVYPGGMFDYHLRPFLTAIEEGTAGMMPYYGMPVGLEIDGTPVPELGFGLNPRIVGGLLRGTLGYDGVVVSDWQLVTDRVIGGKASPARGWGAEAVTPLERLAAVVDAGVDQLGGEQLTAELVALVEAGRIRESRIDESVRRILRVKFALGLFDDPFVDEDAAATVVGSAESRAAGIAAQSRSITVLHDDAGLLPLGDGLAVYVEGIDPAELPDGFRAVADPADADLAVVRLDAPWDHRENLSMEHVFHAGSLDFPPGLLWRLERLASAVPLVVDVRLERPAILTPVAAVAGALVANYGAGATALFDALRGVVPPEGRLPFELPRSMQAVRDSREDVPGDTADPLYPFGHGLTI